MPKHNDLIRAVAYCRKSTKGELKDGKKKQEKSIAQQRAEINKLADGRFQILDSFEDDGVAGWKRGTKRPDFERMLSRVKELGAQAIVCDNIDRFSRAAFDEVQEDVNLLRRAGVRWIITVSHGEYDLGARFDIGAILKFVVAVWAACEYSRQLGRRVALARRNAAQEGIRPGGRAPYGYLGDKRGGLVLGDKKQVATVRWIYEQYVVHGRSLNWIADQLNHVKKVPAPLGKAWYVRSIKTLLMNPVYHGQLQYGVTRNSQFYTTDADGEVVEIEAVKGPGKVFRRADRFPPMVSRELYDGALQRMQATQTGERRAKQMHALSGILYCAKCGKPMYGTRMRDTIVYRCSSTQMSGRHACEQWQVRQDAILNFLIKVLAEEIGDLGVLLSDPPDELVNPNRNHIQDRERLQQQRDKLAARIESGTESLLDAECDTETRKAIQKRIAEMRAELADLDVRLTSGPANKGRWLMDRRTGERLMFIEHDRSKSEKEALAAWWKEFTRKAVRIKVTAEQNMSLAGGLMQDPFAEDSVVLVDPHLANQALRQLGARVTLEWETVEYGRNRVFVNKQGKRVSLPSRRHVLKRGQFQLGSKQGKLPNYVLDNGGCRATCSCS